MSGPSATPADTGDAVAPVVAMVPFADHTERAVADSLVVPLLQDRLSRERVRLIPAAELRETLRSFRIRAAGMIDGVEAAEIRSVRPVDFFLLGSVDLYFDGPPPEVSFALRLVRASDMRVVWAQTVAGNGEDYAGALGLGRIETMPALLAKLMEAAVKGFGPAVSEGMSDSQPTRGPKVALVPFDNLSSNRAAGGLFAAAVLADLIARGVPVIEPGDVQELFRRNNRLPAGGIDDDLARQLHDSLGADLIITGTIDRFQPGSAGGETIDPEIAVGARCLDAATGKITATDEAERRGRGSERLFKSGAEHCLGTLAADVAHDMLNRLLKKKS